MDSQLPFPLDISRINTILVQQATPSIDTAVGRCGRVTRTLKYQSYVLQVLRCTSLHFYSKARMRCAKTILQPKVLQYKKTHLELMCESAPAPTTAIAPSDCYLNPRMHYSAKKLRDSRIRWFFQYLLISPLFSCILPSIQ